MVTCQELQKRLFSLLIMQTPSALQYLDDGLRLALMGHRLRTKISMNDQEIALVSDKVSDIVILVYLVIILSYTITTSKVIYSFVPVDGSLSINYRIDILEWWWCTIPITFPTCTASWARSSNIGISSARCKHAHFVLSQRYLSSVHLLCFTESLNIIYHDGSPMWCSLIWKDNLSGNVTMLFAEISGLL